MVVGARPFIFAGNRVSGIAAIIVTAKSLPFAFTGITYLRDEILGDPGTTEEENPVDVQSKCIHMYGVFESAGRDRKAQKDEAEKRQDVERRACVRARIPRYVRGETRPWQRNSTKAERRKEAKPRSS